MGWFSDVRKADERVQAWRGVLDRDPDTDSPDDKKGTRRSRAYWDAVDDRNRAVVRKPKGGR